MNAKLTWALRLIPAILIGQTLPFKFTGAAESVALFEKLALQVSGSASWEPALRIGTGLVELVAVVLLLIPRQSLKGALLVTATMLGALATHLFVIGFSGYEALASMAFVALAASIFYLVRKRDEFLKSFGFLQQRANALEQ